jgi:hypothetical protein
MKTSNSDDAAVLNFFRLYDSGQRKAADAAYDALSPAARKMVEDESSARSERACRV